MKMPPRTSAWLLHVLERFLWLLQAAVGQRAAGLLQPLVHPDGCVAVALVQRGAVAEQLLMAKAIRAVCMGDWPGLAPHGAPQTHEQSCMHAHVAGA